MLKLNDSLEELKGVGPKFYEKLKRMGLTDVRHLLWHFPSRYEDFSNISKIADLKVGESATIQVTIQEIKIKPLWPHRRLVIVEAFVSDDTGTIKVTWFNSRFLLNILKPGTLVNLAGKIIEKKHRKGLFMSHPIYELVGDGTYVDEMGETSHTGRLVPVYPITRGVTSKALRFLIRAILKEVEEAEDNLSPEILEKFNFPEVNKALTDIHFPEKISDAQKAKKRFAFEDLFYLQLANLRQRLKLAHQRAFEFPFDEGYIDSLLSGLPFELTGSQKNVLREILKDLSKNKPMNRLLQGDVGSGKTIIAAIAGLVVARVSRQTAFMAPTEVLAHQHYHTFQKFFKNFDKGVGLITSAGARTFYGDDLEGEIKKSELIKKVANGDIKIIIGTHALIQKTVNFKDLAFVVIDEQHRFGVKQRQEIVSRKAGKDGEKDILPHFLSMSATPIPRTLSMTLFGDLDLSIIDELPKGRKQIITRIVAPQNRNNAYAFVRGQVKKGRQVFVICPRIEKPEESEEDDDPMKKIWAEVKAVKEEYEKLAKTIFPDLRVELLHGKLKSKEKSSIMARFKEGKFDILVSTSVIEVGVDVPNATIMMIEGADRFGLAQLYQFRGRVGRGEHQSFCLLFTDSVSENTLKRLNSLIEAKNGFELAEKDLEIRGPGEFMGESQTGMPDLAMKAIQNPELVKAAREAAENLLREDQNLKNHASIKERLEIFSKEVHLE